jgi:hypothetical protein
MNKTSSLLVVLALLFSLLSASIATAQEPTQEVSPTLEASVESTQEVSPTLEAPVESTQEVSPTLEAPVEPTQEVSPTLEAPVEPTQEVSPTLEAPVEPTQEVSPTEESTAVPTEEPAVDRTEAATEQPTEEPAVGSAGNDVSVSASTTKQLSTNFTLINFGTSQANVAVNYLLTSGASWPGVPGSSTSFTIAANGGQAIFRQYPPFDGGMQSGSGSVVIESSEPLGAVAQILARNQVPSSGAYSGFTSGSGQFYVPLVVRQLGTASGLANSQIIIQNTSAGPVNVSVQFINGSGASVHTESISNIPSLSSYYYDLSNETDLSVGFFGSAAVRVTSPGTGEVVVVSNLFSGSDGLQTFNAFPQEDVGTSWVVPLFTSRLANGLSTPISVQNLSGGTLYAGNIQLACTKDPASPNPATLNVSNSSAVVNNGSYFFNPVVDTSHFPTGWFGACRLTVTGNVVAFVQMRVLGTQDAAAYEAMRANLTDKKVKVPLVAKRLSNGFATALTVQNLSNSSSAHVTFTYSPSAEYVTGGGSASNVVVGPVTIPPGGSAIQNHRLSSGSGSVSALPDGWYGTVTATSSDQPIAGFVQLTVLGATSGDNFMAHNAFTQP